MARAVDRTKIPWHWSVFCLVPNSIAGVALVVWRAGCSTYTTTRRTILPGKFIHHFRLFLWHFSWFWSVCAIGKFHHCAVFFSRSNTQLTAQCSAMQVVLLGYVILLFFRGMFLNNNGAADLFLRFGVYHRRRSTLAADVVLICRIGDDCF